MLPLSSTIFLMVNSLPQFGPDPMLSLPKEVCSVILDAECMRPIHTACNMVEPSKQCQLVLRHFFNDSGVYCINVSVANDVSLAAATAKVSVDMGTHTGTHTQHCIAVPLVYACVCDNVVSVAGSGLSSPGSIATVFGVLVLVLAVGIVAYTYK